MKHLKFNKNKEDNGYMSNMYPSPILFEDKEWRTAEHLFQALRFNNEGIRGLIRREKSPMMAKRVAKSNARKMWVPQLSDIDVKLMEEVVWLKFEQNQELSTNLVNSGYGDTFIYEDVSLRIGDNKSSSLFWGGYLLRNKYFIGMNVLGQILMRYRFCQINGCTLKDVEKIKLNNRFIKKWM